MLLINEIFSSIQGEGLDVGKPAVFVRLGVCNLQCPWCDTDFRKGAAWWEEYDIAETVAKLLSPNKLVVLTGGEPFAQPLADLLKRLQNMHLQVGIETNGTLWQPGIDYDTVAITCSPKPGYDVHPEVATRVACWKFVWGAGDPLPTQLLSGDCGVQWDCYGAIYIQPRDDGEEDRNARNLSAAIRLCQLNGWRLSVQLHKLIGVE